MTRPFSSFLTLPLLFSLSTPVSQDDLDLLQQHKEMELELVEPEPEAPPEETDGRKRRGKRRGRPKAPEAENDDNDHEGDTSGRRGGNKHRDPRTGHFLRRPEPGE